MFVTDHSFEDRVEAAQALALHVADQLRAGLSSERGQASLVVSGGKSPIPFFHALRQQSLEWSRVWITLADERWVSPKSESSNERLVRQELIQGDVLDARFVSLWTGHDKPLDAVVEVTQRIEKMPKPFDAVVLGMGEDGHTASLFPGMPALDAMLNPKWSVRVGPGLAPVDPSQRLTLTMSALLNCRQVFLSIAGEQKLEICEVAREGERSYPVSALFTQQRAPVAVFYAA